MMVIAPKGKGWSATVQSLSSLPTYNSHESESTKRTRDRIWINLRRQVQYGPSVRVKPDRGFNYVPRGERQ